MKKRIFTAALSASAICASLMASVPDETQESSKAFTPDVTYTGEVLSSMSGGLKHGTRYLGYATLGLTLNTQAANWWKGGELRLNIGNTHGGTPTADLIGDCQTVSNIEAGNHTYLGELWYGQQLNRFHFTIGLQDLNADYATCPFAENYINSSFGIFSTMSANFASPIFPITGLGINLRYEFTDNFFMQSALFDGNVLSFEHNPHNLKWDLDPDKGYLWVSEGHLHTHTRSNGLLGHHTLGAYYHTQLKSFGIYGTFGQTFWKEGNRQIHGFLQASYTDKSKNDNFLYLGGGINMSGIFSRNGNDWLGLGLARACFDTCPDETTLELSYKYEIGEHFFVQPYLQYVIHPAGTGEPVKNALVGILRAGITF